MKYFALALIGVGFLVTSPHAALAADVETQVRVPMKCSRGPEDVVFRAVAVYPNAPPMGSIFTIRLDSEPSGPIEHVGLNYIHSMTSVYVVPAGLRYVNGSAHVVAATGTRNVRPGARAWQEAGRGFLFLPARIKSGTSFTPPSLAFDLRADAAPGTRLALALGHYSVVANAFLVGDLRTDCDPVAAPNRIAVLRIDPPVEP